MRVTIWSRKTFVINREVYSRDRARLAKSMSSRNWAHSLSWIISISESHCFNIKSVVSRGIS